MDKLRQAIANAALECATNLRSTADRLERAARAGDFDTLSEVVLSSHTQTIDWIRGAATAVSRLGR